MPLASSLAVRKPVSPSAVPSLGATPRQGRVLVVDDDPDILHLVREVLREAGWTVLVAENGAAALERLADLRPELILLDKLMPVMDGTTFAATYQTWPDPAPIVGLCAARDAAEWAGSIGAVGYLAKPFDVDRLIVTVAEHIEVEAR